MWGASCASPPLLRVSEVANAGDGTAVRVYGVVADIRLYDSGYTSVLLADHVTGVTVQVILPPSRPEAVLGEISIGDLVLTKGTTSLEPAGAAVFADRSAVEVLSRAAFTMSVEFLSAHWRLFEFDRFNISGRISTEGDEGFHWLVDPVSGHRIRVTPCEGWLSPYANARVLIDCTLIVDLRTMTIYLKAWAVAPFE